MKIPVVDLKNKKVGDFDLPASVFEYPYKEHLIHQAVQAVRAAERGGTAHTKRRHEVAGSGRKPWRQKGTGRARVGSIRTPLWRKGGTVHGPRNRSFAKGLSVNEKKNALKSALSRKLAEEKLLVVDSFELESHKTKELAQALSGLGVDSKALVVDRHDNVNLGRAAGNNPRLKTVDALGVNVYDVVDRPFVVVSQDALTRLVEVLDR